MNKFLLLINAVFILNSALWASKPSVLEKEFFQTVSTRPVVTSSREEALEALIEHCSTMESAHRDMVDIFEGKENSYNASKHTERARINKIKNFLGDMLGFDLPEETPPIKFLSYLKNNFYFKFQMAWVHKLSALREDGILVGRKLHIAQTMKATLEDFQTMSAFFTAEISAFCKELEDLRESHKAKNKVLKSKNKILKTLIDELGALRYAQALIEPWSKTEEELKKLQDLREELEKIELAKKEELERKKELARQIKVKKKQKELKKKERIKEQKHQLMQEKIKGEEEGQKEDSFSANVVTDVTGPSDQEILEEEEEAYNIEEIIEQERQRSLQKRENAFKQSKPCSSTNTVEEPSLQDSLTPCKIINDRHLGVFNALWTHQEVGFKDFVLAFESGLGGKVYKNRGGGSMRTFTLGKQSFALHKPHKGKGKPVFYDELRQIATRGLEKLGITKTTLSKSSKE